MTLALASWPVYLFVGYLVAIVAIVYWSESRRQRRGPIDHGLALDLAGIVNRGLAGRLDERDALREVSATLIAQAPGIVGRDGPYLYVKLRRD